MYDSPVPLVVESRDFIGLSKEGVPNEEIYCKAADEILSGKLTVFQMKTDAWDVIRDWNRDPKTGTRAPLTYGKTIDLHNESLVGDIKYLWEPNRHLHLVPLAQAFFLSNKKVYLETIRLHLASWMDQNIYLAGPNWSSSLEAAIRLINWSIVWQLIGGNESPMFKDPEGAAFRSKWLSSIYRHMLFISGNFSLYSSANNHLIGEAAGLFVGANTWPYWSDRTDRWRHACLKMLADQAATQVHPDGVGREQAIAYHLFVLDFLVLAFLSARAAGFSFPPSYGNTIERMLEFMASMMNVAGNLPMIGDADDGYAVKLSQEPEFCPQRSLLATGAVLFSRADFLKKARGIDDKTRWLVGDSLNALPAVGEEVFATRQSFPNGGYYILGDGFGSSDEVRCIVDCGPIGYLSIAAHGHADALALCLSVGGLEILIDPGTYSYHGPNRWRQYFRGTSAHNTVRVDGEDQSVSGGRFMWIHKADAQAINIEFASDRDVFEGYHDGYRRLDDPVIHRRSIVFHKVDRMVMIQDTISCTKAHRVERFWHFHEDCRVELVGRKLRVENKGCRVEMMTAETDSKMTMYRGDEVLPQGWVSRSYDDKIPAVTVVMENRVQQTTSLGTEIRVLRGL